MTNLTTSRVGRSVLMALSILIIVAVTAAAWMPGLTAEAKEAVIVDLDGTSWVLESINGEALVDGSEITAAFGEGQMTGSAGVNRYFTAYEIDGEKLVVGPAGSTMMMGPEDLMAQEMAFHAALGSVESFNGDGDTLEIVYAGGSLLFTATK